MRVACIGASHWHLPLYLEPLLEVPGVELVGVSDPDAGALARLKATLGCAVFDDYRRLCETTKPHFVFALGRHVDMPAEASFLIEAGIPFTIEKPCGIRTSDVRQIAEEARRRGAFVAVPFVFRNGELLKLLRDLDSGNEGYQVMSFRFIAGFPTRYLKSDCAWMLDPALCGGGSTANLSVHFFDLFRLLTGEDAKVVSAAMSNASWNLPIEDHSAVVLAGGGGMCLVETGYLYPAPTSTFDLHYSIRAPSHYIVVHDWNRVEILDNEGRSERRSVKSTNVPHYRDFVFDVLERAGNGKPPLASLDDMVAVMELVEEAYSMVRAATGKDFNNQAVPTDQVR